MYGKCLSQNNQHTLYQTFDLFTKQSYYWICEVVVQLIYVYCCACANIYINYRYLHKENNYVIETIHIKTKKIVFLSCDPLHTPGLFLVAHVLEVFLLSMSSFPLIGPITI